MADTIGTGLISKEDALRLAATEGMGETRKAFTQGLISAGGNLLSAAAAGAQALGLPAAEQDLKAHAAIAQQQADIYRPQVLSPGDIRGVGDALAFIRNNLVQQVPQLATGILGGLAGGFVAGVPGAVAGSAAGFGVGSFPQNVGQVYEETGNAPLAFAAAVPMTALDIIPEAGAAAKAAHGAVSHSLRAFGKEVFQTGLKEGATEAAQEAIQIGAGAASGKDYNAQEITQRLLDSAITGAAVGSAFPAAVEGFGRARSLIGKATGTSQAQDFGTDKANQLGAEISQRYALPPAAEGAPTVQLGAGDVGTLQEALASGNARPSTIELPATALPQEEVLPAPQRDLFGNVVQQQAAQPEIATAQAPTSDYAAFASEYLSRKPDASFQEIDQMYRGVAARRLEAAAPELRSQEARSRQGALDLGQYDITPAGAPLQLEESPLTRNRPESFATSTAARSALRDFAGEPLKGAGWKYATKAMEGSQNLDEAMGKLQDWVNQVGEDKSVAAASAQARGLLERYEQQKRSYRNPAASMPEPFPKAAGARKGKKAFISSNQFTVETEDNGTISATVHRTAEGNVVISTEAGLIEHNAAFAKNKTDAELLKYSFEPVGVIDVRPVVAPVAPEVQAQVQAATPGLPQSVARATVPMEAAPKVEAQSDFTSTGRSVDQNPQTAGESSAQMDLFGKAPINDAARAASSYALIKQTPPKITAPAEISPHIDDVMGRGDAAVKALGRRLKQIAGKTPVVFVDNPTAFGLPEAFAEHYGSYDETTHTIYINNALANADGKFDEVIMHETVHAATVQWAQQARENPSKQDAQILGEFDKMRDQLRAAYPDHEGIRLATDNVEELLAYGLTNRDFQNMMKAVNEPHGAGIRDLFTKFAQLLRKALGIPDGQATVFSKFIDLSSLVLDGEAARVSPEAAASELGKTGDLFWAKKVAFAADGVQNMNQQQHEYIGHLSELAASVKEYIGAKVDKLKSDTGFAVEMVDAMSENTVVERFKGKYKELSDYLNLRVEQDAFSGGLLAQNEKWASETSRLPVEQQQAFGKLAIEVTTANVSPLKDWSEHTWIADAEKAEARQAWQTARDKLMTWKRDKPKLYEAYVNGQKNIKTAYAASYEQLQSLMLRISGFDTKEAWDSYKAEIIKQGKDKTDPTYLTTQGRLSNAAHAMRTIKGDYWPLRRDGNYVVMYQKGENGSPQYENGVQFAESETEANRIAADLEKEGYTVGKDYKTDRKYNSSSGVPAVVTELVNAIDSAPDMEADQRESLKDSVYRAYIRTMGDESISAKLRRKNVAGASTDMLRAVSSYLTGSVAQTAKLKYDHQIYKVIDEGNRKYGAKRLADGSLRVDPETGLPVEGDYSWGKIRNSLMRRVVESGAETSPFIHSLTQAAHTYYLGFSPAFLITNISQPWMVGWPRFAAQFGAVKSAKSLAVATGRATKLLAAIGGELAKGETTFTARLKAISDPQSMFSADNVKFFEGHGFGKKDLELLLKLQDNGVIDFTQASSLLGYARGESTNGKLSTIAKVAGTFAHYSEMMNRLAVSFAYADMALEKKPNLDTDTLVREIKDANDKINLDYTQRNRAPAFSQKGFLGKLTPLVLQFQQYSFQMMEGIYVNTWKALDKTLSPAERKVAAQTMLYSALSTSALAGTLGLPFVTATAGIINMIANIFSDDNEPFDIRTALRNHMYDLFGETGQRMLTDGMFSAIGVNIQDRAGLQDLLPFSQVIASDTTLQQAMQKEAQGVWGPAGQMVLNGTNAVHKLFNGDVIGAFRVGAPTALKNLAKAYEAQQTKHFIAVDGSPLPVQANMADVTFMALGFTPADLAAYRQGKGRAADIQRAMSEKRSYLLDNYMRAVLAKDTGKVQSVVNDIQEFNAANPTYRVQLADIRRLQSSFQKLQRGGLPLPPTSKQKALLNELRFAQVQPEEEQ